MMNVERFVLGLAVEMRGVLETIGRQDRDLEKQARRALTSVVLNGREGAQQMGGTGRARFDSAMGSADEVKGVLMVAAALGYIEARPKLVDGFDRAARTYCKLRK